jgi:hypothetical protein
MNKKFMLAAALAVTTFSAGLAGNVASASQTPAPKAPIAAEQQHNQKDVKPHKAEPQKEDVKKHDKKTANEKPVKPQQDKKQLPPQAR